MVEKKKQKKTNKKKTLTPKSLWLTQKQMFISATAAAAAAKSLQSCPTLCDPIDDSPPGPAIPRILQARTLE